MAARAPAHAPAVRRVLLVCNPRARRGDVAIVAGREALEAAGVEVLEPPIEGSEQLASRLRAHRDVDAVVIAGGDGTVRNAIATLRDLRVPFGLLPHGTANDLARTLGLPLDPGAAARIIATGRARPIDLGCVNGRYFLNAAGIGLATEVTARLTPEAKRRWGMLGYVRALADALAARRPFTAYVRAGETTHRLRAVQLTIGNGRHHGGGLTVAELATIDDGLLDLYSLPPVSLWRLAALIPALRRGRQGRHQAVAVLHAPEIHVATERPMPISADGEIIARTPARFQVLPAAVRVIAPPGDDGAAH